MSSSLTLRTKLGENMLTAYHGVFEGKLKKLKDKLKKELSVSKDKRNREFIKSMIAESKGLKKTLKKMEKENSTIQCPKCNHEFTI